MSTGKLVTSNGEKVVMPEKVPQPDKEAMEKEIERIGEEIKALTKKMEHTDREIQNKFDGTKGVRSQREEARKVLQVIRDEKNVVMEERKRLFDARDAFNKSLTDMKEKWAHSDVKFRNVEDIDKAIERLEYRQSTSSLPISEEKKLVKEIEVLKKSRATLAGFVKSVNPEATKEASKSVQEKINLLNPKLKEITARYDAQMLIVKQFETVLDSAHKDEVPGMKQKKADFKTAIDQKYAEQREIKAKYNQELKAFRDYSFKVNQIKYDLRKAEKEEKDKYYQEQRRIKEEEEEKIKPWLEEIAICDLLITYCKSLLPKKSNVAETSAKEEEKALPTTMTLSDGTVVEIQRSKKFEDLDGPSGQMKTVRKKTKTVKSSITHGLDTISDYKKIGLSAPLLVVELEKSISDLVAKRAYFDTKPRDKKKVASASTGKKVSTPYGKGTLLSTRADGMNIIEMDWVLANEAKVIAYMLAFKEL